MLGVAIYALGGARPQTPDLDGFLAGEGAGVVLAAAAGQAPPGGLPAPHARDREAD